MKATLLVMLILCPLLLSAQNGGTGSVPAADTSSAAVTRADSAVVTRVDSAASAALTRSSEKDSSQVDENTQADRSLAHHISPAIWLWSKDSIAQLDYHHAGEIAATHPAAALRDLGIFGQPAWISMNGSSPLQSSVTINGINDDNLTTSLPDLYRYSTEDAQDFTVYPMYQAFWYGAPGDQFVMNIRRKEWDAPRPITRLRHTEAAYNYLYTDAMFSLNPAPGSNLYLGLTRSGIGVTSSNNAARYANNRYESWNVRARYRNQLSKAISFHSRLQYDDNLTLLNGGIKGTFLGMGPDPYVFEKESVGNFAETAFDPVAAELVNSTMWSEGQHYLAEVGARIHWSADSSQVTQFRISIDSDVRRFRDNLLTLNSALTIADPALNLTDHWSLIKAVLDHQTDLEWANLTLQGLVGRYGASMGGEALDEADIIAHARGQLSLLLGPVSISGFGRLDYRFESSTASFGAGGELPIGPLSLWGGLSYSARPQTLVERMYTGSRVSVIGDRTTTLDKLAIAEAGLRFQVDGISLDLRGFIRNETRYLDLRAAAYTDSLLGRYRLVLREIPDGRQLASYGGSIDAKVNVWRIYLDQKASFLTTDGNITDLLAPQVSYSAELYYGGMLIEGTLHLRAGVSFSYTDRFTPLIYHPETGMFLAQLNDDPALRTYTDMNRIDLFLYATIKERATLHFVLYNLLNSNYITTGFYPMYDRAFRLGVDWVFFD